MVDIMSIQQSESAPCNTFQSMWYWVWILYTTRHSTLKYQDLSPSITHHPHSIRVHAARASVVRTPIACARRPSLCRPASRRRKSKVTTGRERRDTAWWTGGTIGREWRRTWIVINEHQFRGESSRPYHRGRSPEEAWSPEGMEEDRREVDSWPLGAA